MSMNERLREIERLVITDKGAVSGVASFDSWGGDKRSMLYFFLIDNFKKKRVNYFGGVAGKYIVYFDNAREGIGTSMGSPDTAIVEKVLEWDEFSDD